MAIIYKVEKTEFQTNIITLTNGDIKIDFDVDLMCKKLSDDIFITINKYFGEMDPITSNKIFEIFYNFYVFKSKNIDYTDTKVIVNLEKDVQELVKLIDLEKFKKWLDWNNTDINFPDNIKDEFIYDPDLSVTKEKTYTKKEYQDLIANILCIRMTLPILTEYFNNIYSSVKYNFYKTFLLLIRSDINASEDMAKLRVYVTEIQNTLTSTSNSKYDSYILIKGLSSDDVLEYILADIIFNKLLFLDFVNNKSNIVSFIFQTIRYKNSFSMSGQDAIRSKSLTSSPIAEEISYFEDYRKTTDISLGTIVEIQYFLNNIELMIRDLKLSAYYSETQYKEELEYSYRLSKVKIHKIQIILLGWLLHKYINPRALFYIDNTKIIELLTLANVVMWNAGHKFIALLLTASINYDSNYINSSVKYTFNKADTSSISSMFTFFIGDDKEIVETSISEVAKEIGSFIWMSNTSLDKCNEYSAGSSVKHLLIPNNLISHLCMFVEFSCSR